MPALIDFPNSVLDRERVAQNEAPFARPRQSLLKRLVRRHLLPSNQRVDRNVSDFMNALDIASAPRRVLVVGGGAIGEGADRLYEDTTIRLVSFDIYASEDVQLLADAHAIPFADASFDGVWIQAVLEHVLEPTKVVGEIARILKPGGVVYAETPFLQGVHEGAYDFTRFSESGHRWLFRDFYRLGSGAVMGPFANLVSAVGGAVKALTRSDKLMLLSQLSLFWLNWLDRVIPEANQLDHASAVWFLGRKSLEPIGPRDAVRHYDEARTPHRQS